MISVSVVAIDRNPGATSSPIQGATSVETISRALPRAGASASEHVRAELEEELGIQDQRKIAMVRDAASTDVYQGGVSTLIAPGGRL
jgi:hypothetical protein